MRNWKTTAVLAALTATIASAAGFSPASAAAAPVWDVKVSAPETAAPGSKFRYTIDPRNVGDEPTDGSGSLDITLPAGVKGVSVAFPGALSPPWECGDPVGASTVHCDVASSHASIPIFPNEAGRTMALQVKVEPGASGLLAAEVQASGGGAIADSTSASVLVRQRRIEITEWRGHIATDGQGRLQAGSHPERFTTTIMFSSREGVNPENGQIYTTPEEGVRNVTADLPAGFLGSPASTPTCELEDLVPANYNPAPGILAGEYPACPVSSIVGRAEVLVSGFGEGKSVPIFNMRPPVGEPARFGFNVLGFPVMLTVAVRTDGDLGAQVTLRNTNQGLSVLGSTITFWGVPGDASHDVERCQGPSLPGPGIKCQGALGDVALGPNPGPSGTPRPFLVNPTSCSPSGEGFRFDVGVESWDQPTTSDAASFTTTANPDGSGPPLGTTGCDRVPFQPQIEIQPTTDEAETPTGLEVALTIPPDGINNPTGISQSHLKDAIVTLPDGMTVNPSQANGLEVCTAEQIGLVSGDSETVRFNKAKPSCPDASQLGEVRIDTPLLNDPIFGAVNIAAQDDSSSPGAENPFNSTLALYIVAEGQGILIKLAGEVAPDPNTGQIVTRFLNNPQQPFERFALKFKGGQRAPLSTPPACGTHKVAAELSPWARPNQPVTVTDSFNVTKGPNGGPCPAGGVPPFKPGFTAGSINNNAGSYSPFVMRLTRQDGEQDMTKFGTVLPPGVVGKLAGVSKCSEADIANARSRGDSGEGRQEIASPSCPANSQIGRLEAGAGVGSIQVYVPGKLYLAGPYKGAPLSVVAITPAVAGPFDVGTVVVREGLDLNAETSEVEVDGSSSDPIPHILAGIPLRLRDLRVFVDRDNFILNPTNCEARSTRATLFGSFLDVINPADDVPTSVSDRFQAANCASLPFKPRLSLKLKGGTKRGDFPGLRAVLNARPGDANIGKASVTLPSSAFLEQGHIGTICTRVQFAAKACPPRSVYGYAKAITPLLDEPLEGPVYLRSSNNKLPDLVAALKGIVDVNVVGRIDSVRLRGGDAGIRSSFETVPDAPVTSFVLTMQGGKKGLIVNSRNLCRGKNRADARFTGQNGVPHNFKPLVKPTGCGKARKGKRGKRR